MRATERNAVTSKFSSAALRELLARLRGSDHPEHKAIAAAMVRIALFLGVASAARAIREMAIAYRYGVGTDVDAYLFVFNLVSWPVGVWMSVLTIVLVPLATRLRDGTPAEANRFRAELFGLTLVIGTLLAALAALVLSPLLRAPWVGLPPATAAAAARMVPALALLLPLGLVIGLLSSWMMANARHENSVFEGIPSAILVIMIAVFADGSVGPLVWGTVFGVGVQVAALCVSLSRAGSLPPPRLGTGSPHWAPFWAGFGHVLGGQVLMTFIGVVDQFYAAHLGTGAIATLGYANRILTLLLTIGGTVVSRATLPVFSAAESGSQEGLRQLTTRWTRLMFAIGLGAALVTCALAPWGVDVLFQRGAFTARDGAGVTEVVRYGAIQFPFYFAGLVIVSRLASRRRYRTIFVIGAINLVVKVVANSLAVPFLGLSGLMIATSIMLAISYACLRFADRRRNFTGRLT